MVLLDYIAILFLFVPLFNTGSFLGPIARVISVTAGPGLELCLLLRLF